MDATDREGVASTPGGLTHVTNSCQSLPHACAAYGSSIMRRSPGWNSLFSHNVAQVGQGGQVGRLPAAPGSCAVRGQVDITSRSLKRRRLPDGASSPALPLPFSAPHSSTTEWRGSRAAGAWRTLCPTLQSACGASACGIRPPSLSCCCCQPAPSGHGPDGTACGCWTSSCTPTPVSSSWDVAAGMPGRQRAPATAYTPAVKPCTT